MTFPQISNPALPDFFSHITNEGLSLQAWTVTGVALTYALYLVLQYLDVPVLAPNELLWNALVYVIPSRMLAALGQWCGTQNSRELLSTSSTSERHAVKSKVIRNLLGLENRTMGALGAGRSKMEDIRSNVPPGLGNWDNSCYQNSVLQGLSALRPLRSFLTESELADTQDLSTTTGSLRDTLSQLSGLENNGKRIWTPAKLKSMSSWQQQDAQEYFSKIIDELDKETLKAAMASATYKTSGLGELVQRPGISITMDTQEEEPPKPTDVRSTHSNPLEGLLAQRVACVACGFSEELSLIPFNCITLPLGRRQRYDIAECLDEYAALEEISGVECAKCTLRKVETQLSLMTERPSESMDTAQPMLDLPPEVRQMVAERLQNVRTALDENDFSDSTLTKNCQISKKARVTSTKTRQAVVARAPKALVLHVNRSLFDEYTGAQMKNYANVSYPKVINLDPWCLGAGEEATEERWTMGPKTSMVPGSRGNGRSLGFQYALRAVVTHQGRHENGHYICYRQHPATTRPPMSDDGKGSLEVFEEWWRLSDDDVTNVTEDQVLCQPGAFMLFYERFEVDSKSHEYPSGPDATVGVPAPAVEMKDGTALVEDSQQHSTTPSEAPQDEAPADISSPLVEPSAIAAPVVATLENGGTTLWNATQTVIEDSSTQSMPSEVCSSIPTTSSTKSMSIGEDGSDLAGQSSHKQVQSPSLMRTSRKGSNRSHNGFLTGLRTVAAS